MKKIKERKKLPGMVRRHFYITQKQDEYLDAIPEKHRAEVVREALAAYMKAQPLDLTDEQEVLELRNSA